MKHVLSDAERRRLVRDGFGLDKPKGDAVVCSTCHIPSWTVDDTGVCAFCRKGNE